MTNDRIRRWTWTLAILFAAIGFVWVLMINQGTLASALGGSLICAVIPVVIGGGLLFAPPNSIRSPLRYMGRKPPTIAHSDELEKHYVTHKPKDKCRL